MNYQEAVRLAPHRQALANPDRFVPITEREDRSDIPISSWASLLQNTYYQSWKGIILNKCPTEIATYPMLLHELQPRSIIEVGILNGGSALWLADLLDIFGIDGKVYGVDIDIDLLDELVVNDKRLWLKQGDANHLEEVFPREFLDTLPHPWLVIEDAHVNVTAVAEHFHRNGLQKDDYLIIEDTNKSMWEYWDTEWTDTEEQDVGRHKLDDLRKWLSDHNDEYLVDTHYQDIYGYNGSKNWNSVLKRVR